MKILIIEDEPALRKVVQQFLESLHFLVEYADDYSSGLQKIEDYEYDCILLDIMLPGGNGLDILQKLKEIRPQTLVIILSAKDSVEDKVSGLDLGADDYLAKPFSLAELHSRINSSMRRHRQNGQRFLSYKNLALFPEERALKIENREVLLNRKEFDILHYFMQRPDSLMQKTSLAESIWGDNIDQADSLDFIYSQIKNLRKKLKDNNSQADIHAVYGVGYRLI